MPVSSPALRSALIGNAALAVTVLAWGAMAPLMHELMYRYDALEISVLRYVVAAPLFIALLLSPVGGPPPAPGTVTGALPHILILGLLGVVLFATAYTFGIYYAGPVQSAIVNSAAPVIALGVGWMLTREVPDRALLAGIALAVPGAALALSAGNSNAMAAEGAWTLAFGVALIMAANLAWAFYSALARRWLAGWNSVALTASTMAAGGILLGALYLAAGFAGLIRFPPPSPTAVDAAILSFIAVVAIGLGVVCWNVGVERLGLPLASLYINLTPVVALALAAALGATLQPAHLAGTALVILGLGGAQLKRLRDARRLDLNAAQAASER